MKKTFKKDIILAIQNNLTMFLFAFLSVHFNKWWIMIIAILFVIFLTAVYNAGSNSEGNDDKKD